MKKFRFVFIFIFILIFGKSIAVFAQDCNNCANPCAKDLGTYCVTYHENNCLRAVPIDQNGYKYGDTVTVLFEPVLYKDGLIFYGWSHSPNGYANYGYAYNQFIMPAQNVDLYAICIVPYYGPQQPHHPHHPCPPCYPPCGGGQQHPL